MQEENVNETIEEEKTEELVSEEALKEKEPEENISEAQNEEALKEKEPKEHISEAKNEETPAAASKEEKLNKKQLAFLLGVYFILLLWVVLFKCNDNFRLSPEWQPHRTIVEHFLDGAVPFRDLIKIFKAYEMEAVIFIANFILFIPMGILLPFFMSKKKSILVVFAVALGIEVCQLFTGWGGYDTTDVIMTFLGGLLGVWLYKLLRPILTDRTVNKISFWLSAIFFPMAIFTIVNTALHFPPIYATKLW